jgi:DHA2 family multidrug resistance protein
LQGAALGLIFVPLTTVTNDPVPKERIGNATSLFNLMRNIGASIGISAVTTIQVRNSQKHLHDLGANVSASNLQWRSTILGLQKFFISKGADPATAMKRAYAGAFGMVQRQAAMLSYADAFRFLGILFVVMFPLIFLMKKPKKKGGPPMGH